LAHWQTNFWQPDSIFSGQQPALALTDNGFTYWAWEQTDRLAARYRYAGWSEPVIWAESAEDNGDLALTDTTNQAHVVWVEQTSQGWQVFYDASNLTNAYTPLILK
jgi:hypothetical protein